MNYSDSSDAMRQIQRLRWLKRYYLPVMLGLIGVMLIILGSLFPNLHT